MGQNGQPLDDLERRATELAKERLVLRDRLFETWEEIRNLKGALRDISAKQRTIDSQIKSQGTR